MTLPCMTMEFFTTAPWPTLTPRKMMEFSTVMQGSVIDDNAQLDYVILDKDVLIKDGRRLAGYLTYPVYVPKKSHI